MEYMPFGKHKGRPLSAVPDDYLMWVLRERIERPWWLRDAVAVELGRRTVDRTRQAPPPPPPPPKAGVIAADVIGRWFRKLAFQYHPDRNPGSSGEAMRAINTAKQLLEEMLAS